MIRQISEESELHRANVIDDELFVFLRIGADGVLRVFSAFEPGLGSTPLLTGSPHVAELLKLPAESFALRKGGAVGLFRFKREEELWRTS